MKIQYVIAMLLLGLSSTQASSVTNADLQKIIIKQQQDIENNRKSNDMLFKSIENIKSSPTNIKIHPFKKVEVENE